MPRPTSTFLAWQSQHPTRSLLFGLVLRECACLSSIQKLLRIETAEELDQLRHYTSPSSLVTGSKASAVITVEVLVQE